MRQERFTPAAIAIFDVLADGEDHANVALIQVGARAALAEDYDAALANGKRIRSRYWGNAEHLDDGDVASVGAADLARNCLYLAARRKRVSRHRDRHRMFPDVAAMWRDARPHLTLPLDDRRFGGLPEWEGWLYAPLKQRDLVHFRTDVDADLGKLRARLRRRLGDNVLVTGNGDGLVNIVTGNSEKAREEVRAFCAAQRAGMRSLRTESNVRRRDIGKLPPGFVGDLLSHYGITATRMLSARRNQIADMLLASDADDIRQHAHIIVLDAVSRFDDASNVPFEAYVAGRISRNIGDMARERYGRSGSDAVRRYKQFVDAFREEMGHEPTLAELAEHSGTSPERLSEMRQITASIDNVRDTLAILPGDGSLDDRIDHGPSDSVEQRLDEEQKLTAIAKALVAAARDTADPIGWAAVYLQTWTPSRSMARTAKTLGVSEDAVRQSGNRVREAMRSHLEDTIAN